MKLTAKTDLDAPIGFVYECLLDHPHWEHQAAERGIDVERPAEMPMSGVGAGWLVRLPYRGKLVKMLLRLVEVRKDESLGFELESNTIEGGFVISVMALSPRRTRLHMQLDVRPRTLAARVVLNTMRLAKGRVQARLDMRIQQMGTQIAQRFAAARR